MRLSNLSIWNNKWSDVFDFTPIKNSDKLNYSLNTAINPCWSSSLKQVETIVG